MTVEIRLYGHFVSGAMYFPWYTRPNWLFRWCARWMGWKWEPATQTNVLPFRNDYARWES